MSARSLPRGLYVIADTALIGPDQLVPAVVAAITGGARTVQYRDKHADARRRVEQARALREVCDRHSATLIVNDDVDLAQRVAADGVHLGRDDEDVAAARARLGDAALVGASCYDSLERARAAAVGGASYVAFGSFFASATKPAAVRAPLALLKQATRELTLPVVAIGGITPDNGHALVAAGAHALAVISGVFAHADVRAEARRYARLFEQSAPPGAQRAGQMRCR